MVGQISAQVEPRIGVIGLGYVGLPLAVAFGRQLPVVGYDIDSHRVAQLRQGMTTPARPQMRSWRQRSSCALPTTRPNWLLAMSTS